MSQNESTMDRVIRFVLGAVLVYAWYAALVTGVLAIIVAAVGVILLITGVVGWCPIYSLFGSGTNPSQA